MMRIFDWLFVNHLFGTNDRGETIFYPNGLSGTGYLVPPERAASVRSGMRRLVLFALTGALAGAVLVPRAIEAWLGISLPIGWFIAVMAVVGVIGVTLIIRALKGLTAGLEPMGGG